MRIIFFALLMITSSSQEVAASTIHYRIEGAIYQILDYTPEKPPVELLNLSDTVVVNFYIDSNEADRYPGNIPFCNQTTPVCWSQFGNLEADITAGGFYSEMNYNIIQQQFLHLEDCDGSNSVNCNTFLNSDVIQFATRSPGYNPETSITDSEGNHILTISSLLYVGADILGDDTLSETLNITSDDVHSWSGLNFTVWGGDGQQRLHAWADISSFSVTTVVPLPHAFWLFASGLGFLVSIRKRCVLSHA